MTITLLSWAVLGNPIFPSKLKPWCLTGQSEGSTGFCKNNLHCIWISGYFKFQYNWFLCYASFYWICLYMKTASKDYLIFKKQAILIIRRIKVSIKDKSILCTKQCKHEMNTKTISEIDIYTSKPQMSSPVPNWNPFQHTSARTNV